MAISYNDIQVTTDILVNDVVNDSGEGVYSSKYINNTFGKGIITKSNTVYYLIKSGFSKAGEIEIPADGTMILTVSTYYYLTQPKKLAVGARDRDYKDWAATNFGRNDVFSVTLCADVKKGEFFDVYTECMMSGEEGVFDYTYIIFT